MSTQSAVIRSRWRIGIEKTADVVLRGLGLLTLARDLDARRVPIVRVLAYHRVNDPANDPLDGHPTILSAAPEAFVEQVRLLTRYYTPIGPAELRANIDEGRPLPSRAVMVTFDDGYRDFMTQAWPVLKAQGVPVVLFVPTAFPGRARSFWWDELWRMFSRTKKPVFPLDGKGSVNIQSHEGRWTAMRSLLADLAFLRLEAVERRMEVLRLALDAPADATSSVLTWDELRALAKEGVIIGSHGRNHASMPSLTPREIAEEIEGSQADLERELGPGWRVFAYPFGHCDPRVAQALQRSRFLAAFGTLPGRNVLPIRNRYSMFRQTVNAGHSFSRMQLGLSGVYPGPLWRLFKSSAFRTS